MNLSRLLNRLLDFVAVFWGGGSSRVLALSIFSYSSEILEKRLQAATRGGLEIVRLVSLETNQDSAANRAPRGANFQHAFAVHCPRLKIKKIACIYDRLSAHRQT